MEQCQRCKEDGEDRRTLWMACFYEMMELGLPFEETMICERMRYDDPNIFHYFYTLKVCKDCRAEWMKAVKKWFYEEKLLEKPSIGSGIFVMTLGQPEEITVEEWNKRLKEKESQ